MSFPPKWFLLVPALLLVSGCASFAPDSGLGAVSNITAPALGRPAEALAIPDRLAVGTAAAGEPAGGYGAEEAAECLLALGREDEARPRFARAAELLGADAWLVEHEADRIARLRRLGTG